MDEQEKIDNENECKKNTIKELEALMRENEALK